MTEITAPGWYEMPAADYHADPVPDGSLSSGGARKLLPPSCPAKFKWLLDHPEDSTVDFDFGHAAHKLVLGAGPEVVVVDADNWKTAAAREERDAAYANHEVPMLAAQWERAVTLADAVRAHPHAGPLFQPGTGLPERSGFWVDHRHEVWRRALLDWIPHWRSPTGQLILPELKTCRSADEESCGKAMDTYGYDQQAAWYMDAAVALELAPTLAEVVFLFVFVEKDPPHLLSLFQPDVLALERGRTRNQRALRLFAECRRSGVWPGYGEVPVGLRLPRWAEARFEDELRESGG